MRKNEACACAHMVFVRAKRSKLNHKARAALTFCHRGASRTAEIERLFIPSTLHLGAKQELALPH